MDSLKRKSEILKALAHPSRLWIIESLYEKDRCVCEFVDALKVDYSTVSKHLSILKNAGFISSKQSGKERWYSLRTPCIKNFMDCIETMIPQTESEQTP
ncbi:ArsR/SmtB family transcription factor [Chitinivibrio alkaliphilus]|uniref:ArsR family transcriptional regulator n=1 Tax=Chitinivibrio alkaliphilus ACht1 TaxID=1313304 RepID=U7D9B9_9BACT|nr:metalloregulator ArsR/SmtB family transcription factor [Chitinivibrio alkaliphilus]ERP31000.1 ArsR family transcriptional regulator [Chitinivibrio alkaliphilus ACht1]